MQRLPIILGATSAVLCAAVAVSILLTGTAYVPTVRNPFLSDARGWPAFAMSVCWASLAAAGATAAAANFRPKRYYFLMWVRDAFLLVSALSLVVATAIIVLRSDHGAI